MSLNAVVNCREKEGGGGESSDGQKSESKDLGEEGGRRVEQGRGDDAVGGGI